MKDIMTYINEGSQYILNKIFSENAVFPMECTIPVLDPDHSKQKPNNFKVFFEKNEKVKIVYALKESKRNIYLIICEYPEGVQDYYWSFKNGMFMPFSEPEMDMGEYWAEENLECPKKYYNYVVCKEY